MDMIDKEVEDIKKNRCENCGHAIKNIRGNWYHIHVFLTYNSDSGPGDTFRYKYNKMCYEKRDIEDIYDPKYETECECKDPMPINKNKPVFATLI